MRRTRYSSPDGHDWRDPEMPVLCLITHELTGEAKLEAFPSWEVTEVNKVWFRQNPEPDWRNDPTYNLRKAKHGRRR